MFITPLALIEQTIDDLEALKELLTADYRTRCASCDDA
jgi:hypothetical protein